MAKNSEDIIIKVKASHVKTLFPKDGNLKNSENNFGIVIWEVVDVEDGDPKVNFRNEITIKGSYVNDINWKKIYIILAKQVEHPQYGTQYELLYYVEDVDFSKISNQRGFLREFLTEKQIDALYGKFDNPLEVISNNDKEALMTVKGIGDYISDRIIRDFNELKDMSAVFAELDGMGLTTNFINRLISNYKSPTTVINVVKEHPYQLIEDMDGVGFITADKIALAGGMPIGDKVRIKSFVEYYLKQEAEAGNSYITAKELNNAVFNQLGNPDDLLEFYDENDKTKNNLNEAILELENDGVIHIEDNENKGKRRVYLQWLWNLEREIAYHLKRIMDAQNNFDFGDFDEKIKYAEERQGFEFTDEQLEGIKLGLDSQVCLITGPAGSGKSSLVSGILAVLDRYDFAQCALSGKAAARLQEVTGQEGSTIHRLLGYDSETGGYTYTEKNPLPYDIIILDEISLVGGEIFRDLLRAIPSGAKFYMLGDPNQLEAIGSLNLAADMVNSDVIPTVSLKQVHRQAKKSGILTTAYDVKDQIQLFSEWNFEGTEVRGELQDMILEITEDKDDDRELVVNYFKKYFEGDLVKENIMAIQVLSPVKERGEASVFKLNKDIQELINPYCGQNFVHIHKRKDAAGNDFSFDLREGDKIMCIKNNYKIWTGEEDAQTSIFNGWTGIIKRIVEGYIIVNFPLADYPEAFIPTKEAGNYLTLGYASTVHKIQGSDYPVIIGVVDFTTPPQMLTHQLVYTLLTRAKKLCVLVAQNKALRKAIDTDFVSTKRTFLPEMLEYSKEELLEIANINIWDEKRENYKDLIELENEPEMESVAYINDEDVEDVDDSEEIEDDVENDIEEDEDYND